MNSTLVVCYSYTGVSRRAAQLLCSLHDWPLAEIRDSAPRGLWRCVLDSLLRRQPEIAYEGPAPSRYRTVVLMAPIWMGRLAWPMRTFITRHAQQLPRVAVIATMNSSGDENAFREVGRRLGHAPFACAGFRQKELEDGSASTRLLTFGDSLVPVSPAKRFADLHVSAA